MDDTQPPVAESPPPGAPAPAGGRSRWKLALLAAAGMVGLSLGLSTWILGTEAGLRTVARLAAPLSAGRVEMGGAEGSLLDSPRLGRLRIKTADQDLTFTGLALDWSPSGLFHGHLDISRLAIAQMDLGRLPSDKPSQIPKSLQLPLAVRIATAELGRLNIIPMDKEGKPTGEPLVVTDVRASLESDGRIHDLRGARAVLPFGELQATVRLDGKAPFQLEGRANLATSQLGDPYKVHADLRGPLSELGVAFRAEGAKLAGSGSLVVTPFGPVPLRSAKVAVKGLDPSRFHPSAPQALLDVDVQLAPELPPGHPPGKPLPRDRWVIAGPLRLVNHQPGSYDLMALPLERAAMHLRWAAGELAVSGLEVGLPGEGRISGTAKWRPGKTKTAAKDKDDERSADRFGQLDADLKVTGVDARRLDQRLPTSTIAGSVKAEGTIRGQTVEADLADPRLALRLSASHHGGVIKVTRALAQAGKAQAQVEGEMDLAGDRRFSARGSLSHFDPSAFFRTAPRADLNSRFSLSGQLKPQLAAAIDLRMEPSQLEGRPLSGGGSLALTGKLIHKADLAFDLAGNRINASGRYGRPGDVLKLDIDAPALEALGPGFAGRVKLSANLHGTYQEPGGEFNLVAGGLVLPGSVRLDAVNGQGKLGEGRNGQVSLAVAVAGLRTGKDEHATVRNAQLSVEGTRNAHQADLIAYLANDARLSASLAGGLTEGPAWKGKLNKLTLGGDWRFSLAAPTDLSVAPGMVRLGPAELRGKEAVARLEETFYEKGRIQAKGRLSGLLVGVTIDEQSRRISAGGDSLRLGAEWDVQIRDTVNGLVRVFREGGDLVVSGDSPVALGLSALEVTLTANDNRLALGFTASGSQLGQVSGAVTALAERTAAGVRLAPDAPLLGSAKLNMPSISWAGPIVDQNLSTGGQLRGEFTLSGTPANPVSEGRILGDGLSFAMADQGLALSGGTLVADFNRERVRISDLSFISPNRARPRDRRIDVARLTATPGRLVSSGEIRLADGVGQFTFRAERLPLLQRADRWLLVSGEGEARTGHNTLALTGRLVADAGYIERPRAMPPSLSEDVVVYGTGREGSERRNGRGGFRITTDLTIVLGDAVYVNALGLDTRLSGELRLRSTEGGPLRATGTIHTVGGVYEGYGQKLQITRGIVNFAGPLDNPGLNVVALRQGLEVEAGVAITGTARRPIVRLVSDPNVPDPEKLGWIILGRPPDRGSGAELALLVPAAQALLGGSSGGGISDSLARSLGLDEVSLGTMSGTGRQITSAVAGSSVTGASAATNPAIQAGTLSSQVVTLGKRLSSDLFLSFEQGITGAASIVKLTYQLTRRISLVARAGTDNALDLNFTLSFR